MVRHSRDSSSFAILTRTDRYLYCEGWPIVEGDDLQGLWPERAGEKISFLNKLWMPVVFLKRMPRIIASRPSVADARVRTVGNEFHSEGIVTLTPSYQFLDKIKAEKKYEQLGLVGFCYGGGCVVRAAGNPAVSSIVVCHPSGLKKEQIQAYVHSTLYFTPLLIRSF